MKILLIGAFAFDTGDTGGQPVKSRELFYALKKRVGESRVDYIETKGWKKHPIKLLVTCFKKAKTNDCIIMLPAHNGLKVFARLLVFIKKILGKKIYYDVIGGWLPKAIKENTRLLRYLKEFNAIWVETSTMKNNLNNDGLDNVEVIPNFKNLTPLKDNELIYQSDIPLKICTFSRVMEKKGIKDIIKAVNIVNRNEKKYDLDIYGPIDDLFLSEFNELLKESPDSIRYCGCKRPDESVEILKKYFALIFPTKFYTEGIPGTIIDAYYAGVPVIASKWESFDDVIDDKKTGVGYEFNNINELVSILVNFSKNPNGLNCLKRYCLDKSKSFSPEYALELMKIGE